MAELAPCPFCGSRLCLQQLGGRRWRLVDEEGGCLMCGTVVNNVDPDDADAIAAWNRRVIVKASAHVESLTGALRSLPRAAGAQAVGPSTSAPAQEDRPIVPSAHGASGAVPVDLSPTPHTETADAPFHAPAGDADGHYRGLDNRPGGA